MIRFLVVAAVFALGTTGCTLLLPTDQIIKACTANVDCDPGFDCEDNACLPLDGEGEGEGEGE